MEKGRGLRAKSPSPSSSSGQNRGGEAGGGSGPCRPSGVRRRLESEGKGRGSCGESIPVLTLGGGGARRRLCSGGRRWPVASVEAALRGWGGATAVAVMVVGVGRSYYAA